MKTSNAHAIIVLCSHLCKGDGIRPLEPSEWTECADKLLHSKKQPCDMLDFSDDDFSGILGLNQYQIERYNRLRDRSASIAMEYTRLESMGISITTRADLNYPALLKKKLSKNSPPLFYYCGDIGIANDECIGFVGSRNIEPCDADFTKKIIKSCLDKEFSIVSGGARGVDSTAAETIMRYNGVAIEYVADSLSRKIKDKDVLRRIRDERLLILSAAIPTAGFNVGMAMQRNKYIYSQSLGTVVVRSDYNKGGTWAGATENLRRNYSHTFCWNNNSYKGNIELINLGAIPIDDDFNPNDAKKPLKTEHHSENLQQMSFFDTMSIINRKPEVN